MNAKPAKMHILEGNPNRLTKAEIKYRIDSEIHFGSTTLTCPSFVKSDSVSYQKWKEITKLYKEIDFVSSGDAGHLARYCKAFSEYQDLLTHRQRIQEIELFTDEERESVTGEFATHIGERAAQKMWQKVEYIMSMSGLLSIDKAINAKMQVLTSMEDRLFLNPLSKIKNVPKKEEKQKSDPHKQMFGD